MIAAGLAEPVDDAQRIFRAVLTAMARPGTLATLAGTPPLPGLAPAAAAFALALADLETSLWLAPACAEAAPSLRFHCGAPIATSPGTARFAFARGVGELPELDAFALGSDDYPDRSTTLVLDVASLEAGHRLRLSGPGIDGIGNLSVGGIDAGFWAARAALAPFFPRGLDLVLVSGTKLAALPRTTRVEG